MNPRHAKPFIATAIVLASHASATPFTWDADGLDPLNNGGGSWASTGGTNWQNGASYGAWGNTTADEAIFGVNTVGSGAAGAVTVSGTVTANKITFNAAESGNYTLSTGTISLGGTTPTITTNVDATINSLLAGSAWTKDGAGTLTLSGSNNTTGNVTIAGGKVILGTSGYLTGGASNVTVNNGAVLAFTSTTPLGYATAGSIGPIGYGSGSLVLNNGGLRYGSVTSNTPAAYGSNDESRNFSTSTNAGTLEVVTSGVTWTFGTYRPANNSSSNDNIVNNAGLQITGAGNLNIRKYITGTGGVTMNGTGTLTLGAAPNSGINGWDNTYSGDTTINSGTLQIRSDRGTQCVPIPNGAGKGNVAINSPGKLDLNTRSFAVNGLSGTGTVTSSAAGAVTFTAGANDQSSTFTGVIEDGTGTLSLAKSGTGTLTLSGTQTYTGTTTVNGGALLLTSSLSAGSATTVNGTSGTAYGTLGGTGTLNGAVTVNSFAHLSPSLGTGTAASTLTVGGNLSLSGGSIIDTVFALNGSANDRVAGTSTNVLTLPASGVAVVNLSNSAGGLGNGTYTLFSGFSSVAGNAATALTIGTTPLTGKTYTFANTANGVTMTIANQTVFTWSGAGANNNWQTGGNWIGGSAPTAGTALRFAGSTRTSPVNNLTAGTSFSGLSFLAGAGAFTPSGNAIELNGDIANLSSNAQAANLAISLIGLRTVDSGVANLTLGGNLSGSGSLTKTGASALVLGGNNGGYSGDVLLSAGTIRNGSATALPVSHWTLAADTSLDLFGNAATLASLTGDGTVTTSAAGSLTLTVGDATDTTFNGIVTNGAGTVGLTKTGTGTLNLTGLNDYSGPTTITQGTLQIGAAESLNPLANVTIASGATLALAGSQTFASVSGSGSITLGNGSILTSGGGTIDGVISGNGSLTKTGVTTMTLGAFNTYTGGVSVQEGVLAVSSTGKLFTSGIYNGATVMVGNGTPDSATLELSGWSYDTAGSFGALDSAYTKVMLNGGTIRYVGAANPANTGARRAFTVQPEGGTLIAAGTGLWTVGEGNNGLYNQIPTSGLLTLAGSANGDFKSYITGSGAVVKSGTGTWLFGSNFNSEHNTYSGDTTINQGTLQLRSGFTSTAIPNGADKGNLIVNGPGILDLNTRSVTVNGLAGTGKVTSSAAGALTFTAGANDQTSAFAGVIENGSGSVALAKIGSGTLTLGGTNTYSGGTTVTGGALELATGGSLLFSPTANHTVNTLGGTGGVTLNGTIVINLGAADTTGGNSWTLVDVDTLAESYGANFTVSGFTEGSPGVWTKNDGTRTWTFTEATGKLTLPGGGYTSWIASQFPGESNPAITGAEADPDKDGVANGIEFMTGSLANSSASHNAPVITRNGSGDLIVTFQRVDDAEGNEVSVQYGTDLQSWTTIVVPNTETAGPPVTVVDNGSSPDTVTVVIPGAGATRKFARVRILVN